MRRGIKMFERVNTRVLGVVENMCGFQVPGSGEVIDLFGRGGGEELAAELSVPLPRENSTRPGGQGGGRLRRADGALRAGLGRGGVHWQRSRSAFSRD